MKKILKAIWEWLQTEYPEAEEPETDYYYRSKPEKDNSSWCPFCGYSGSADELRCHLLNDHKK